VGLTGMGLVEIASLSTITAQSLATISSVGGPGENYFGTTNRFASAWAAGTPLFNPTKNLTFPELTNRLPLKRQCAAVSTSFGATSVPVQELLRLKRATVTTPTAEIGQTDGSAISP